jgi:hypothetical protein
VATVCGRHRWNHCVLLVLVCLAKPQPVLSETDLTSFALRSPEVALNTAAPGHDCLDFGGSAMKACRSIPTRIGPIPAGARTPVGQRDSGKKYRYSNQLSVPAGCDNSEPSCWDSPRHPRASRHPATARRCSPREGRKSDRVRRGSRHVVVQSYSQCQTARSKGDRGLR